MHTLEGIDEIFLAGGTAVQCCLLEKKYRESEDFDFFVAYEMSSKESSKLARNIIKTLSQNKQLHDIRHKKTEDGTHRIFCGVEGSSEIVLTGNEKSHYSMKEAIVSFQNDFANTLLLAP